MGDRNPPADYRWSPPGYQWPTSPGYQWPDPTMPTPLPTSDTVQQDPGQPGLPIGPSQGVQAARQIQSVDKEGVFRDILLQNNIDPNLPLVQASLAQLDMDTMVDDNGQLTSNGKSFVTVLGVKARSVMQMDYPDARARYGFGSLFHFGTSDLPKGMVPSQGYLPADVQQQQFERSARAGLAGVSPAKPPKGVEYVVNNQTGSVIYRNGVIADLQRGAVYFPMDPSAPGSPLWFRDVQENWSAKKLMSEQRRLKKTGYLPANYKVTGGFDLQTRNALASYQKNRYLNFGKELPATAGGAGADVNKFQDVRDIIGSIRQDVRDEYRRVYGAPPSSSELQHWTSFIIETANRLQRSKDLATGTAVSEAEARAQGSIEGSPLVKYLEKSAVENTSLRDGLARAAAVAAGLRA